MNRMTTPAMPSRRPIVLIHRAVIGQARFNGARTRPDGDSDHAASTLPLRLGHLICHSSLCQVADVLNRRLYPHVSRPLHRLTGIAPSAPNFDEFCFIGALKIRKTMKRGRSLIKRLYYEVNSLRQFPACPSVERDLCLFVGRDPVVRSDHL